MSKLEPIHDWKRPKEVDVVLWSAIMPVLWRMATTSMMTLVFFCLPVLVYLSQVLPEGIIRFEQLFYVFPGAIVVFSVLGFIRVAVDYKYGTRYSITVKGITRRDLSEFNTVPWTRIRGYSAAKAGDSGVPGAVSVLIHAKPKNFVLWLPEGELVSQVIETLQARCPLLPRPEERPRPEPVIAGADLKKLLAITLLYCLGVSVCFASVWSGEPMRGWLLAILSVLVFGPGTLGTALLFGVGSLREKHVRAHAVVFNLVALVLLLLQLCLSALITARA